MKSMNSLPHMRRQTTKVWNTLLMLRFWISVSLRGDQTLNCTSDTGWAKENIYWFKVPLFKLNTNQNIARYLWNVKFASAQMSCPGVQVDWFFTILNYTLLCVIIYFIFIQSKIKMHFNVIIYLYNNFIYLFLTLWKCLLYLIKYSKPLCKVSNSI